MIMASYSSARCGTKTSVVMSIGRNIVVSRNRLAPSQNARSIIELTRANTRTGIVRLGKRLTDSGHEDCPIPLPRTPFSSGNHQLYHVGLSSVLYELP